MSFITAPFREDRGRRILTPQSQYSSWDFLKDTRPEAEKRTHPIGRSDGRASKFKVGFYRRPAAAIDAGAERIAYEEQKEIYAHNTAVVRQQNLFEQTTRNGNVLAPAPVASPHDAAAKIFPSRRRFPSRVEEVAHQNHARQKVGASRFHVELTPSEVAHRERQLAHRLAAQQRQTTSVIGYGREDLRTRGVLDNFREDATTYEAKDLISRPKVKPAPAGEHRATVASLVLSDGSSDLRAAASRTGLLSNSSAASLTAELGGRRAVNRSNQTSAALAEVFQYAQVDGWQRRTMPPPPARQQQHSQASPAVTQAQQASAPAASGSACNA